MKIATYNVNSIGARLPVLLHWLASSKPDVACLQELKTTDEKFPVDAIREAGYEAVWHGQKAWNGVAILARGEKPRGDPARPARRPGRHPQPLHRGRRGRRHRRLPLPAQRQPGPGPEVRLQAEVVRAAQRPRRGPAREGRPRRPRGRLQRHPDRAGRLQARAVGRRRPVPARDPRGLPPSCSPRAGRMRCGTSTRTRRSTPSGTTCGAPSPATRASASTTCS